MLDHLRTFIRKRGASHPALYSAQTFPSDLFAEMGRMDLLRAANPGEIARGSAIIAEETGSLGLAMAWTVQTLVPLALDHFAGLPAEIKTGAARGEVILALAVSEPGAGAHPKYLRTSAARTQAGWQIDGEKVYITNGPIASHLAVLSINGGDEQRKAFSFFLAPVSNPGVTRINQTQLDYLRPAQHCGFKLEACQLPESALIGPTGDGYTQIARPFRDLEDGIGAATLAAILARAARCCARSGGDAADLMNLGELAGIETALSDLVSPVIAGLERWETEKEAFGLRLVAIYDLARRACAILSEMCAENTEAALMARDAEMFLGIAKSARQTKKARLGQGYYLNAKTILEKMKHG